MEKQTIRSEMLRRRAQLSGEEILRRSRRITAQIISSGFWQEADTILAYCAVRGEADLTDLITQALSEDRQVCLPRTFGKEMRFLRYAHGTALEKDTSGIPAPPANAPSWDGRGRTLVIVPGAAFSPDGYRIGYGGGFYDRFFAAHGRGDGVMLLGAAYAFQFAEFSPEPHDVRLDAVAAEERLIIV